MSVSRTITRARLSHGTHRYLFTVASSRIWRGSQACAAWDPAFNTIARDIGPKSTA